MKWFYMFIMCKVSLRLLPILQWSPLVSLIGKKIALSVRISIGTMLVTYSAVLYHAPITKYASWAL